MERVDAISRAMFMSLVEIRAEGEDLSPSEQWARMFWRTNWRIFPCSSGGAPTEDAGDSKTISEARAEYYEAVKALHEAFLDVALKTDPDLFEPDRYEVLTGITSRALRLAAAAA